MEEITRLLQERNSRETEPFVSIHEAYSSLLNQVDALVLQNREAERQVSILRHQLQDSETSGGNGTTSSATKAALKSEARLREKMEKLQGDYNSKLQEHADLQSKALENAKQIGELKDQNNSLKKEKETSEKALKHLNSQLSDAKSRTDLAEKQYEGLKKTIRTLQAENDKLSKENRDLEQRIVTDKGMAVDEMNILTEMVDSLKRECDMLRSYNKSSWFNKLPSSGTGVNTTGTNTVKNGTISDGGRKWGAIGTVLPSSPRHIVAAHSMDGTCCVYDSSGNDLIATGSSDSTVKVWNTNSGTLQATLHGTTGHAVIGCDISGNTVVGAGSDKTCRVWNLRTQRMIHQLVGHAHKITCVRLFAGEQAVVTGSADRCLKVWDISRKTYRQTTTLRHSSTSNCVDVGSDNTSCVSGHLDGGLRFWDLRTGERTENISSLHEAAVTSCKFSPTDSSMVLTNGLDNCLKITDIRSGLPIHTFRDDSFSTLHGWSSAAFSPDGRYIVAGSSMNGTVLVWNVAGGALSKRLQNHHSSGVCGVAWGRGGSNGQQVASLDRKGSLVLWA